MSEILLSMKAVANLTGFSQQQVWGRLKSGKLQGFQDKRGKVWIEFSSVVDYAIEIVN